MKLIAELSANHNGSLERALDTVKAAAWAGADYIKFQTFEPEQMTVSHVLDHTKWKGYNLLDLYKRAHTPKAWHPVLFEKARELGITPMSSPFHRDDVDFLETLDCPVYKIASFELVDLQLIEDVAQTGKPIIMSTGGASASDIYLAYTAAKRHYSDVTLLHCVSEYPTKAKEANLRTMTRLAEIQDLSYEPKIGLSDHSNGITVPIAATAMGAQVIEKHLTISKDGLDAEFSLLPEEFKEMVTACKEVEAAIGVVKFGGDARLRRSLYYARDIEAGSVVTEADIKTARPAMGLNPQRINEVIGSTLKTSVKMDEPVMLK